VTSKTARRDAGSGGLYQRADGLWVAALTLPDRDGRRRRKTVSHRTKEGAAKKLKALRSELDRAGDLPTSSPTLATWMETWLQRIAAPRLKPNTLTTYRGQVDRYIVPAIGKVRLDKLTPAHVRRLHDYIIDGGRSSTTALQAHRILSKALTDAMREGKVTRNVATLIDAPRKAVVNRGALTADQARTLLLSVAKDPHAAASWSVALLAGLRQGERLGLTREAVDLDAGIITVSWQLQRLRWQHGCSPKCGRKRGADCPQRHITIPHGQEARQVHGALWLTRPKSRAGWRQVPIASQLHGILTIYLDAFPPGDEGLIFTRPDRHPIDPSDDAEAWDRALKAAGLPDVPLHSARHTTATLLHELQVPDQTRIRILGHSSATVTAGYTHVSGPEMADAMARLGALVVPQLEP